MVIHLTIIERNHPILSTGAAWCAKCGSNINDTSVKKIDIAACIPVSIDPQNLNNSVFECQCQPAYNGKGSTGVICNGEHGRIIQFLRVDYAFDSNSAFSYGN